MFNLFNGKEDSASGPDNQKFESFQDNFSPEQRAAILTSLVSMAKSDGEAHPKELQLVEQARKLLGVELDDPILNKTLNQDIQFVVDILNSLEPAQKEWFISSLHRIILADGKIEEAETNFIKEFCRKLNISEFDYLVMTHK